MRLYVTDLNEEKVLSKINILKKRIRHIFFEGGRNIPMNKIQREAMFRYGLLGILETSNFAKNNGIWNLYNREIQENVNSLEHYKQIKL